jgi:hypothetical protein
MPAAAPTGTLFDEYPPAGDTQVDLTFKVQSASGVFAGLHHKTVTADLQLNPSAETMSANFA